MSVRYEVHDSVAVIALDNPPVNGLGHATRTGVVGGRRAGECRSRRRRHRAHRRRQAVLGRRRHPRIQHAQIDGGADAGHGDSHGRGERQAGDRRDRRDVHGRRPGARAGLPLARGEAGRRDRVAGGEARHPARRRRDAAAAARGRGRDGAADDRQRRERRRRRIARQQDLRCHHRRRAPGRRARVRPQGRRRKAAGEARARHRNRSVPTPRGSSLPRARGRRASREHYPAPHEVHRCGGGRGEHAVRPGPRVRAQGVPGPRGDTRVARAAPRVLRRAGRGDAFPACPTPRRRARSGRSASSAPARWAPASR